MYTRSLIAALVAVGLSSSIFADDQIQTQNKEQAADKFEVEGKSPVNERELSDRGPIYGIQLMAAEEQHSYRTKLHSLEARNEQEQFLREHHKLMNERAAAQGITLRNVAPKHRVKTVAAENKPSTQVNIMGPLGW